MCACERQLTFPFSWATVKNEKIVTEDVAGDILPEQGGHDHSHQRRIRFNATASRKSSISACWRRFFTADLKKGDSVMCANL